MGQIGQEITSTVSVCSMTDFIILLFFTLLVHKAVCLKFKGGDFILLDYEPENLLYENTFVHDWRLCRVNSSVISPYEYNKKGYINENCSNKNWDNKHPYLKYAWFYSGVPDTEVPTCTPLSAAESYFWNCEKDLPSNEVTPYRNCTPVCNEGYTLLHNVTTRCSVNLTWTWFGDKDRQFCEKTYFPDSTQTSAKRPSSSAASIQPPTSSSAASHQSTGTKASQRPTSTFSSVTVPYYEADWTLSDLSAIPINRTAIQLTWKVLGSQHYPTRYTLVYHILGETTLSTVFSENSLHTIISQLEPDSKYFFKLCAEGNNERYEICANTTIQTKAGGKRNTQSTNVKDIVYIVTGATIGGILMLVIIVAVVYCKCRSRKQITSSHISSENNVELPVNSPLSQNSCGQGNCFGSCEQEESSFTDSSKVSHSGSSSITDSPDFHNKNGKDYQESKEKLVDFDSGDKKQRTPIDVDSGDKKQRVLSDVDSAETNNRKKQEINSEVDMLECRKINSINENDICMNSMLCGRSQPEEKETDYYSSIFDGELLLLDSMSEHSTMNTVEEPILFLTKDEEKKALLETCGKQEEDNKEMLNPSKKCNSSFENNGTEKNIHCERQLEIEPFIKFSLDSDVPELDDLTHNSSGLASVGVNFYSPDLPKPTEYDKNVNVDGSRANSLHAMDPPSEMYSAQPYAAAAEFHPLVNGNQFLMPKPDSFDYSRSRSSSSQSHQKESKALQHQNTCSRDNKLAAHASISQTFPSQGGRSSCDIDAMNNQVVNQNVSVGRGTHFNNSDNSTDQNTRSANSISEKECEPVQRRLPFPLLLPRTQPLPNNRQNLETDGQESSTCTMPISKAKDILSLTFFVRLGYHIDPDSFYGPVKSWFGLSLQVLKLSEEEVQSIR
ncbi:unnamed protein product [Mytilus coruscus]|uniref:Fibronectin type-III domain-containing protein n=1 Tax=Mytilus coruscus TaxID=42192 RepID=A0A6J7ZVW3_MYTCO|nr:unnamed protein product [Mytilus coruscus]